MKNLTKNLFTVFLFSFAFACQEKTTEENTHNANHQEEMVTENTEVSESKISFEDESVSSLIQAYLSLKDALVQTDGEKAKQAALNLLNSVPEESNETISIIANEAKKISETIETENQRAAFDQLSEQMITLVKNSKLTEGKLYKQYCPMAKNNEGAYWLSTSNEIRNPYFGDKMLKCGSVEEVI
ncbi:DUF3347 domain-containing protein [Algoriphagus sp.]|uniref:DUF3347 domain-containing protein n=1 Tax=Algoriphagus sp. TaxID=1872435 RepID=UPI0025D715CD|nr:DUF3347 domain-containing protein [Algoriphagus sp.]